MPLFRNCYRVESARLQHWDYRSGCYHVTVNTFEGKHWFGAVKDAQMYLSKAGEIVVEEWLRSAQLRSNILLDRFQVMPNHFHGLISIIPRTYASAASADLLGKHKPARLYPDSLGSVMGQFKAACTARIRKEVNQSFQWQERFRDQVVHSEKQLNDLREYLALNPRRWEMKRQR